MGAMSPIHGRWKEVPQDLRELVSFELKRLSWDLAPLIHGGFAFVVNGTNGGRAIRLERDVSVLSEGQRTDALKQNSPWHIVLPLRNSSNDKPHLSAKFSPIDSVEFKIIPTKAGNSNRHWHRTRVR